MPTPLVVMKQPSALPRSTTLVSPVTRRTPAFLAAALIESTMRASSASGNPSSRMKAALRYRGRAPAMARSFTVPLTASTPMSPPGKKSGVTTWASVVKARRTPPMLRTAWSSWRSRYEFRNEGRKYRAIRSAVILPPLPWPSSTRSVVVIGAGQLRAKLPGPSLDDIVFPQGHVHQVPHDVVERHVRLLDAVNAEGGHDEAVLNEVGESAAVLAGEGDGEEAQLTCGLERLDEVGRLAARAHGQRHVAWASEDAQLVGEHLGKIAIVGDGGEQGRIGGQRHGRQGLPLLDDGMEELDGNVLGIRRAPAVAHLVEASALREASGHGPDQRLDAIGLCPEELLLDVAALARF